jgi:hypothetical protein
MGGGAVPRFHVVSVRIVLVLRRGLPRRELQLSANLPSFLRPSLPTLPRAHTVSLSDVGDQSCPHEKLLHLRTTLANNKTWESHRLDELPGDCKIKTGRLILLTKKKKRLKLSLLHDYRPYLISAASWSIEHPSWKQPLHVHAVYRNHAVAGRGPGESRQQKETEEQQAKALRMIASEMDDQQVFSAPQ